MMEGWLWKALCSETPYSHDELVHLHLDSKNWHIMIRSQEGYHSATLMLSTESMQFDQNLCYPHEETLNFFAIQRVSIKDWSDCRKERLVRVFSRHTYWKIHFLMLRLMCQLLISSTECYKLTLKGLSKIVADDIQNVHFNFSEKIRLGILCESSAWQVGRWFTLNAKSYFLWKY